MAKAAPAPRTYQKGFNQGYILAKHAPELFSKLLPAIKPDNEYQEGLLHGSKQYEKEQQRQKGQQKEKAPYKDNREHDLDKDR